MAGPIDEPHWRPIGGVDQGRLKDARLQAHHAVQWLARVARGHISPQPDDGHTCLHWDSRLDAFATQTFAAGTQLVLQIPTLTLALESGEGMADSPCLALSGQTDAQVRHWLGKQFEARGLDPSPLDDPAPYEIPMHAIGRGTTYDAHAAADALTNLAAWYANAVVLLEGARRHIAAQSLMASPLCCWPHHFDLAALAMLPAGRSGEIGSVGIGLSPGDEYYDEPYFYVSIYPDSDPAMLPPLPMVGNWHTSEFTAAVAPAHKILAAQNQRIETDKFLRDAVAASLWLLDQASQG
jgi:hypothetical protein